MENSTSKSLFLRKQQSMTMHYVVKYINAKFLIASFIRTEKREIKVYIEPKEAFRNFASCLLTKGCCYFTVFPISPTSLKTVQNITEYMAERWFFLVFRSSKKFLEGLVQRKFFPHYKTNIATKNIFKKFDSFHL